MEEVKILKGHVSNLPKTLDKNTIYVATSSTQPMDNQLFINGDSFVCKHYIDSVSQALVTREEFEDVEKKASSALQRYDIATINGKSLIGGGDIEIDLSLYEVVDELPTENILTNKIYLQRKKSDDGIGEYYEQWMYDATSQDWKKFGKHEVSLDLSDYVKTEDADKRYMKLSNGGTATIAVSNSGTLNNFGDNGQAFNAVRECKSSITGYKINAASFGVKLDGTTAFSHKKYDTYNADNGSYSGAKNTAVLTFSGPTGFRYAKNIGGAADVTEEMYKYVGVIDSPDEKQRVYSKTQVDTLLTQIKTILLSLGATQEQINTITI